MLIGGSAFSTMTLVYFFIEVDLLTIEVRPSTSGIYSETPDKSQLSHTELWTKYVIDYVQYLLDEFIKIILILTLISETNPCK